MRPIIVESPSRGRRIDPSQSRPRSLDVVGEQHQPVLAWILHALAQVECLRPLYVGGYHIEKVIETFPGLDVRYQPSQGQDGEVGAFLNSGTGDSAMLLISAGTVLLPGAIERLCTAPLVRGVYDGSSAAGVYYAAADQVPALRERARLLLEQDGRAGFETLFAPTSGVVDVSLDGLAAPVTDQEALARTIFRGKAQTLDNIGPLVRGARLLPRERVALPDWKADREAVLDRVMAAFPDQIVAVRSSASSEDGLHASGAGKYRTMLDIRTADRAGLGAAIESVVESYGAGGRDLDRRDEVLIQPQLTDLRASGVLLTRDPRTSAPYFVLNEDSASGRSDVVTAGSAGAIHQHFVAWTARETPSLAPGVRRVLALAQELIDLSQLDALDIEYAITMDGAYHLLQVRPLPAARKRGTVDDEDLFDLVSGARAFVAERMRPASGLLGSATVLGVMPDWNPAEMIGLSPRPLALSLYQKLIGARAWAEARQRIGYRDLRPEPLILAVGGRPFVDVRASLNSLLPALLDEESGARWVDACLERLRANPALHDKIEFELAISCLAPDWPTASARLREAGLDPEAFAAALRPLTQGILDGSVEPIGAQMASIQRLESRRQAIGSDNGDPNGLARAILHHLEDCRDFGVVPFSILARYGFISLTFLRGFVAAGVIDEADMQAFLRVVPTVAGSIADDIGGGLAPEMLLARYGHLRPNSYEITSPNYASDPARFLRAAHLPAKAGPQPTPLEALSHRAEAIETCLRDLGLNVRYDALIRFFAGAIAGREQAKFEFMKSLDAALELMAALGGRVGFDRDQLSFLPVDDVLRLATDSLTRADRAQFRRRIEFNRKRWSATGAIRLPDVIRSADEVGAFQLEAWRANFVTRARIAAPVVWLDETEGTPDLTGKIVITRAADPGYDWIFAHGIAGLVTEYGGAASHMAIRAAEFGLPAAIGCGSVAMESLRGARVVELDCAAEQVRGVA